MKRGGRGRGRGGRGRGGHGGGGHSFEQQGGGGKKKNKKAKAPKEINYSHYCDVCDRGFQSDEELKSHIAEHVKCEEKDCRFVGHPKVVKLHHKLHHGPGSRKIKWLDTPDEIQKWRNERKRNFPTAENIAKKGVKIGQREEQGNVLETKHFGKMKRKTHRGKRGGEKVRHKRLMMEALAKEYGGGNEGDAVPSDSDQVPPKRRKTDDEQQGKSSSAAEGQEAKASDPTQATEGIAATGQQGPEREVGCDPLSLLASHNDNESGDEEAPGTEGVTPNIEVAPKGTFGALGSLAACYDSDSGDSFVAESDKATKVHDSGAQEVTSQETPEQCPTEEGTKDETPLDTESRLPVPAKDADETRCHGDGRSDERMDVGAEGQEKNSRGYRKDRRKQKRAPNNRGKGAEKRTEQNKATLLEMLLAPEIRRERNIILQCVRHVVKKNFFQGSKP
ncbi:nuclear fragile X mental retardation-interacting protein 1 [Strongylocentrotus purpuratus]|uniref:C2H2-type domain-containing protein n=1 Tax=Strongylocentrotus purpuratus TaxID=7668 RepID=A0A7M7NKK9_STRPU|nr:nuclear fragile X mental retardation-interacting protein 1 [Strongylocentrotus purpuratus]